MVSVAHKAICLRLAVDNLIPFSEGVKEGELSIKDLHEALQGLTQERASALEVALNRALLALHFGGK